MESTGHSIADVEATRGIYMQFVPHQCNCAYCRNFRAQWKKWITDEAQSLLYSFGVDPVKPVEIIDFGNSGAGRLYQIEWAFLLALNGSAVIRGALHLLNSAEIVLSAGGMPALCFDNTGRRWSLRIQYQNVPWLIQEAEPD